MGMFSALRDVLNRARNFALESRPPVLHGAVVDTSDYTLVAIGPYPPALFFLNESVMDTEYVPGIIVTDDVLRIIKSGPRMYPEWSWDNSKRAFKRTNPAIVTENMRERAVLSAKKVEAISYTIYRINRLRAKLRTGFLFQGAIYAEKKRQARYLKDTNFDERGAATCPYVVQYADACRIPLRQAAEEILLQDQLDHEHLAKTEKIRLALSKKIRSAKTVGEIEEALDTFRKTGVV